MRRSIQTLALAAAGLCAATMAAAAPDDSLTVGMHQARRVMLHGDAATVVLGDPKVADVTMVDTHSVIIMGKAYGATPLIITDRAGHTLLDSEILVAGQDSGRLTVYRGPAISEMSCATNRCHSVQADGATGAVVTPGGAPGAQAAPSSGMVTMTISAPADQMPAPHP